MAQKIRSADGLLRNIPEPGRIILPKDGEKNILITSALPYCNNVPHLGNIIGSTLSADVYARYCRTRNVNTLYICGTDEYGTATETQALKEGITPKELCDKYNAVHRETYEWFQLGFDYFGRTSTDWHTTICQDIFRNLGKNGHLEQQNKEQTYCEGCSRFLADRYVEGTCPHCNYEDARGDQCDGCTRTLDAVELIKPRCMVNKTHTVTTRVSTHSYLKLQDIQPKTEEWIKKSWKAGKWSPNSVINSAGEIVDARMKGGLIPTPLTRDLTWGVPVPIESEADEPLKGKVLYVWFDAPIGYPSITANYTPEWKQWWFNQQNVRLYQFMGKDNVYFHTVYFPSVILGDGRDWTTLHHVSTTEYLNYEGGKFSKSRNRGVFGPAAKETGIPASVWRFYLLWNRPETADSMFSWEDCINYNNSILLNNFGNFVNRVLKFVTSQYGGVIPEGDSPGPLSPNDEKDTVFVNAVNKKLNEFIEALDAVELRRGLQIATEISQLGNGYLQSNNLTKALLNEQPEHCAQVITRAVNLIYVLSALIHPYMPSTSDSILRQLNAPPRTVPDALSVDILPGHTIGTPELLFQKIDLKMVEEFRSKFGGLPAEAVEADPKQKKKLKGKNPMAAKPGAPTGPKTPEQEALDVKITEQGNLVRSLKAQAKTPELEAQIKDAVDVLKKLKAELTSL